MHFFFTINPYSIVKETLRPRGPTLEAIVRLFPPLVRAGLALVRCADGAQGRFEGKLVELIGIEPTTLCLQSRCSPS